MDKKKVFAIALFLLMGLFMFSYANPLSNNDNNLENGTDNGQTDNISVDNTNKNNQSNTNKVTKKSVTTTTTNLINANGNSNNISNNIVKHTITFIDGYSNEIIANVEVENGSSAIPPIAPIHNKMLFNSWIGNYTNVLKNETVIANYKKDNNGNGIDDDLEKKYDINFLSMGRGYLLGQTNYTNILTGLSFNDAKIVIPTPIADKYYKFNGWDKTPSNDMIIQSNLTFNGMFKPINDKNGINGKGNDIADEEDKYSINISYVYEDNSSAAPSYVQERNYDNLDYNVVSPIVAHYTADKLVVKGTIADDNYLSKKEIVTYTRNKHNVTFINNGSLYYQETVNEADSAIVPKDPTKVATAEYSYTFAGWYDENNQQVTDFSDIENDMTVTARYTATTNKYTVTFADEDGTEITTSTVDYGTSAEVPNDPTKAATAQYTYTFAGWYNAAGNKVTKFNNITEDFTVTARYTATTNKYTVTFVDEDGTKIATSTVDYGTSAKVPNDPTKAATAQYSYTFAGWFNENGNQIIDFSDIENDMTVTARYTATTNKYTVTFADEDGTKIATSTVDYGTSAKVPNDPAKAATAEYSYTFAGWYDENNQQVTDFSDIENDMTVTARYTATTNKYTVTFADEDGTEITTSTVDYGTSAEVPNDPTKAATAQYTYTFAGWYNAAGNKVTKFNNITEDFTVTARYTATTNKYTVTFVDEDGTKIATSTVDYGTSAKVPKDPTKVATAEYSYTFAGWFNENGNQIIDFSDIENDMTVTAQYAATTNKYTVTFADEDGTKIATSTVDYGTSAEVPKDPTKAATAEYSYTFAGWYNENNQQVTDFSDIENDMTVRARYTVTTNKYTVTFVDEDGTKIATSTVDYGTSANVPKDPAKAATAQYSYTFAGWYGESGNKVTKFNNVTKDFTVTARYNSIINKYTVTFNPDNGSKLIKSTVEYGKSVTVPKDPIKSSTVKYSYLFIGWYDESDNKINNFDNIITNLSVKAKYQEIINKYSVTFIDYNGDILSRQTIEYGNSATAPSIPTRKNYAFTGWDKSFNNVTSNLTVKAIYSANVVGIRVEAKGNAQLEFTQNKNYNIGDYINVYNVYADDTEKLTTDYSTDFKTSIAGTFTLNVSSNEFKNKSLSYKVIAEITYQTKFEVNDVGNSFRYTTNDDCVKNCDSSDNTASYSPNNKFIEIIEHYNEIIEISEVKVDYADGTSETITKSLKKYRKENDGSGDYWHWNYDHYNYSIFGSYWDSYYTTEFQEKKGFNLVRWSNVKTGFFTSDKYHNPVYELNVNNKTIKKVTIKYNRNGYGKYDVEFTLMNGKFVCTNEIKK
jgi:uncharacterized repeat protein (TIGR02543 family)